MSKELAKNLGELNDSVKKYIQTKIDLVKLSLLEKLSGITASLINFIIVILFFMLVIGFGAAAFAVWYGKTYNDYFGGLLIAGGGLILLGLIFVLLRKRIITNPLLNNFSEIMFADEEEES